jgi:hypothetical protein
VLYYLVDTEEGGGTIFPLADMSDEYVKNWQTNVTNPLMYKQTRDCEKDPGRVVYPKVRQGPPFYPDPLSFFLVTPAYAIFTFYPLTRGAGLYLAFLLSMIRSRDCALTNNDVATTMSV